MPRPSRVVEDLREDRVRRTRRRPEEAGAGEKLTASELLGCQRARRLAVDQDHESEYDDWLYEKTQVTVAELHDALTALRN